MRDARDEETIWHILPHARVCAVGAWYIVPGALARSLARSFRKYKFYKSKLNLPNE